MIDTIVGKLKESHSLQHKNNYLNLLSIMEKIRSLAVSSPFAMVPLKETIDQTARLLDDKDFLDDLSKETAQKLLILATNIVPILTHR